MTSDSKSIELCGLNIEVTDAINEYFHKKIQKVLAHTGDWVQHIKANFSCENKDSNNKEHVLEIIVSIEHSNPICHTGSSKDMYATIDIVTDNIDRQLRKHKEKIIATNRQQERELGQI